MCLNLLGSGRSLPFFGVVPEPGSEMLGPAEVWAAGFGRGHCPASEAGLPFEVAEVLRRGRPGPVGVRTGSCL